MTSLTPEDISKIQEPGLPKLRPAGFEVAYEVGFFYEGERARDIFIVSPDHTRRAITQNHRSHHPEWSADGRLAYAEGPCDTGDSFIHVADPNGAILQTVAIAGDVTSLSWSPDGSRLAVEYLSKSHSSEKAVRVVRRLRHNFNSRSYIGEQRWQVVLVDLRSAELTNIGDQNFHHFAPSWSSDGRHIALTTTRRENWDLEWIWDVYVVALEDLSFHKVTDSVGVCLYPVWAPNSCRVAYLNNHSPNTGSTSDYHLWEAELVDGSWESRCLSHDFDRGAALIHEPPEAGGGRPVYIRDGQRILWAVNDAGRHRLMSTSRSGEMAVEAEDMGWPSMRSDGRYWAALKYGPQGPPHVTVVEDETGHSFLDIDENEWLNDRSVCRSPEMFTFSSGGFEVQAWLWSTREESSLPLLLNFHGGPHGAFGPYFSVTQQVLASNGFLVAAINYRGSAGYGQAFADLVHANWGPQEGEDGLALINALAACDAADPNRVGVFGPSYGGFMTNWMVTHYPGRVHAGVALSTVSDLTVSALGIDHWESLAGDQGGLPWEVPSYYRDHSPVMQANQVQAPLLLLHGEEDMTCLLTEAEMMFSALRIQRKPVELVRYPGESHSFHRQGRPDVMVDAHRRMVEWFMTNLAPRRVVD